LLSKSGLNLAKFSHISLSSNVKSIR